MSKTDDIIRDSMKNTPAPDPEINRELMERFAQRTKGTETKSDELSVSGVERYRKPAMIRRIGAVAAALAVLVSLGSGVMLMRRGNAPEVSTSLSDPENASAPDPGEINSYDMSTKEGIYTKMANVHLFFDKVSGEVVQCRGGHLEYCEQTEFRFDLTSGGAYTAMEHIKFTNDVGDLLNGADPEGEATIWDDHGETYGKLSTYCNGNVNVYLNENGTCSAYHENICSETEPRKCGAVTLEDAIKFGMQREERLGYDPGSWENVGTAKSYLIDGINSHIGADCVRPGMTIPFAMMSDFAIWDIVGETEYLGRECVELGISFENHDSENAWLNGMIESKLIVDKETGCLLWYAYYIDQQLADLLVVHEISFDDDAQPVPDIDLTDYIFKNDYGDKENYNVWWHDVMNTTPELTEIGEPDDRSPETD